jgi:S1-C subfamily serine protease
MEDILLLNSIERYLDGKMQPDEQAFFEELRKSNPDVDQMVVEHKLFLHQMEDYAGMRNLRHQLHATHQLLEEQGLILSENGTESLKGKVIQMFRRYKRDIAIAASIAGITALFISGLVSFLHPGVSNNQLTQLSGEIKEVKRTQKAQADSLKQIVSKVPKGSIVTNGGTAFLVDGKGYLITSAHVLKGKGVLLVNAAGDEFSARIVSTDHQRDLALLKIEDSEFKPFSSLPYSIRKNAVELGEELFTLGYPRSEIVYSQGYLSAKSGYDGDTLSLQVSLQANPGNSGSPVFNKSGEIIGIVSNKLQQADGVVFAIKSKNIYAMIESAMESDTSLSNIRLTSNAQLKGISRVEQIKKAEDCVFLVKAYTK